VLLNERQYPPLFLHRQVVEKDGVDSAHNFAIAALSLQQQQEQQGDCHGLPKQLR
jgi:hypothetical protein